MTTMGGGGGGRLVAWGENQKGQGGRKDTMVKINKSWETAASGCGVTDGWRPARNFRVVWRENGGMDLIIGFNKVAPQKFYRFKVWRGQGLSREKTGDSRGRRKVGCDIFGGFRVRSKG